MVSDNRFQTADEATEEAAAENIHGTYHNILSADLNMSHVTQHSVPRVMTHQHDDRMSTCSDLIDCADRDVSEPDRIRRRNLMFCV
jgi:hypothetical protein